MRAERANLTACTHHSHATAHHRRAIRLTAALAAFLRQQVPWNEAITLHQTAAVTAHHTGDRLGEADALQDLGRARAATAEYSAAADLLQRSLTLFREVGDAQGKAEALNSTGAFLAASTEPGQALSVYRAALRLAHQVQSPLDEAHALEGTARCQASTGDHHTALADLRQAVSICQRIGAAEAPRCRRIPGGSGNRARGGPCGCPGVSRRAAAHRGARPDAACRDDLPPGRAGMSNALGLAD
ncbi:hypothetical protein GCM10012280_66410 [Wenjunlia tyrosinilytica]|uniref:Tetratricopeptide repeat protein n=1 Tax=Wenjunlia tyrosinilytica TaxID=1544741 RepID=A0A917ZXI3_9ACTN|nr:hypothetical protein GCM10012280_66410 [Wenjunlia tyrosinilytica]